MPGIAFFDVDNTIIRGSTGLFVLSQLLKEKKISFRDLQQAIFYVLLYKLGLLPYDRAIRWIYYVCGKMSIDEIIRITDIAYEQYVLPNIRMDAISTLESYRKKGTYICLATASSDYIANKIKTCVKADYVICNKSAIRENYLTNELEEPICYGIGKKVIAEKLAKDMGYELSQCNFYSDSITDLPLLSAVGRPVIVNPSRFDYWYKNLEKYEVVFWKR